MNPSRGPNHKPEPEPKPKPNQEKKKKEKKKKKKKEKKSAVGSPGVASPYHPGSVPLGVPGVGGLGAPGALHAAVAATQARSTPARGAASSPSQALVAATTSDSRSPATPSLATAAGTMAASVVATGGGTTGPDPADSGPTGEGCGSGSKAFDAAVAVATSPFATRPKCARCGKKDASLVAIHCGCIAACADCATEAKHATRSKEGFKCGQPISGYVQVQGDVTASLPAVGELDATAGDSNEDTDVDEEDEDEEAEDEEGS